MDELNLYDDLDDFQEQQEKKSKELQEVEEKYQEALKTIEELQNENKTLKKNIQRMELGFQSLLDTARTEIKRKDKEIERLRKENDDICFRRKNPHKGAVDAGEKSYFKHHSNVENPFRINIKDYKETASTKDSKVTSESEKYDNPKCARCHDNERDHSNDYKRYRSSRDEYKNKNSTQSKEDVKDSRSYYKDKDHNSRSVRNRSSDRKDYDKPSSSRAQRKSSNSPDSYNKRSARSQSRERDNKNRHERNRSRERKNIKESPKKSSKSPSCKKIQNVETKHDHHDGKIEKFSKSIDKDNGNPKSEDLKEKNQNKTIKIVEEKEQQESPVSNKRNCNLNNTKKHDSEEKTHKSIENGSLNSLNLETESSDEILNSKDLKTQNDVLNITSNAEHEIKKTISGETSIICTPRKVALFGELFGESPKESITSNEHSKTKNSLFKNIKSILSKSAEMTCSSSTTSSPGNYTDISSNLSTPKGNEIIEICSINSSMDTNRDINDNKSASKIIEKVTDKRNDIDECFVPNHHAKENLKTIASVDLTEVIDDDLANEIEFVQIPGLDLCPQKINRENINSNHKTETITTTNLLIDNDFWKIKSSTADNSQKNVSDDLQTINKTLEDLKEMENETKDSITHINKDLEILKSPQNVSNCESLALKEVVLPENKQNDITKCSEEFDVQDTDNILNDVVLIETTKLGSRQIEFKPNEKQQSEGIDIDKLKQTNLCDETLSSKENSLEDNNTIDMATNVTKSNIEQSLNEENNELCPSTTDIITSEEVSSQINSADKEQSKKAIATVLTRKLSDILDDETESLEKDNVSSLSNKEVTTSQMNSAKTLEKESVTKSDDEKIVNETEIGEKDNISSSACESANKEIEKENLALQEKTSSSVLEEHSNFVIGKTIQNNLEQIVTSSESKFDPNISSEGEKTTQNVCPQKEENNVIEESKMEETYKNNLEFENLDENISSKHEITAENSHTNVTTEVTKVNVVRDEITTSKNQENLKNNNDNCAKNKETTEKIVTKQNSIDIENDIIFEKNFETIVATSIDSNNELNTHNPSNSFINNTRAEHNLCSTTAMETKSNKLIFNETNAVQESSRADFPVNVKENKAMEIEGSLEGTNDDFSVLKDCASEDQILESDNPNKADDKIKISTDKIAVETILTKKSIDDVKNKSEVTEDSSKPVNDADSIEAAAKITTKSDFKNNEIILEENLETIVTTNIDSDNELNLQDETESVQKSPSRVSISNVVESKNLRTRGSFKDIKHDDEISKLKDCASQDQILESDNPNKTDDKIKISTDKINVETILTKKSTLLVSPAETGDEMNKSEVTKDSSKTVNGENFITRSSKDSIESAEEINTKSQSNVVKNNEIILEENLKTIVTTTIDSDNELNLQDVTVAVQESPSNFTENKTIEVRDSSEDINNVKNKSEVTNICEILESDYSNQTNEKVRNSAFKTAVDILTNKSVLTLESSENNKTVVPNSSCNEINNDNLITIDSEDETHILKTGECETTTYSIKVKKNSLSEENLDEAVTKDSPTETSCISMETNKKIISLSPGDNNDSLKEITISEKKIDESTGKKDSFTEISTIKSCNSSKSIEKVIRKESLEEKIYYFEKNPEEKYSLIATSTTDISEKITLTNDETSTEISCDSTEENTNFSKETCTPLEVKTNKPTLSNKSTSKTLPVDVFDSSENNEVAKVFSTETTESFGSPETNEKSVESTTEKNMNYSTLSEEKVAEAVKRSKEVPMGNLTVLLCDPPLTNEKSKNSNTEENFSKNTSTHPEEKIEMCKISPKKTCEVLVEKLHETTIINDSFIETIEKSDSPERKEKIVSSTLANLEDSSKETCEVPVEKIFESKLMKDSSIETIEICDSPKIIEPIKEDSTLGKSKDSSKEVFEGPAGKMQDSTLTKDSSIEIIEICDSPETKVRIKKRLVSLTPKKNKEACKVPIETIQESTLMKDTSIEAIEICDSPETNENMTNLYPEENKFYSREILVDTEMNSIKLGEGSTIASSHLIRSDSTKNNLKIIEIDSEESKDSTKQTIVTNEENNDIALSNALLPTSTASTDNILTTSNTLKNSFERSNKTKNAKDSELIEKVQTFKTNVLESTQSNVGNAHQTENILKHSNVKINMESESELLAKEHNIQKSSKKIENKTDSESQNVNLTSDLHLDNVSHNNVDISTLDKETTSEQNSTTLKSPNESGELRGNHVKNCKNQQVNLPSTIKLPVGSKLLNVINTISLCRQKTSEEPQKASTSRKSKVTKKSIRRQPVISNFSGDPLQKQTLLQKQTASVNKPECNTKEIQPYYGVSNKSGNHEIQKYCGDIATWPHSIETANFPSNICAQSCLLKEVVTKEINIEGEIVEVVRLQIPDCSNVVLLNNPQHHGNLVSQVQPISIQKPPYLHPINMENTSEIQSNFNKKSTEFILMKDKVNITNRTFEAPLMPYKPQIVENEVTAYPEVGQNLEKNITRSEVICTNNLSHGPVESVAIPMQPNLAPLLVYSTTQEESVVISAPKQNCTEINPLQLIQNTEKHILNAGHQVELIPLTESVDNGVESNPLAAQTTRVLESAFQKQTKEMENSCKFVQSQSITNLKVCDKANTTTVKKLDIASTSDRPKYIENQSIFKAPPLVVCHNTEVQSISPEIHIEQIGSNICTVPENISISNPKLNTTLDNKLMLQASSNACKVSEAKHPNEKVNNEQNRHMSLQVSVIKSTLTEKNVELNNLESHETIPSTSNVQDVVLNTLKACQIMETKTVETTVHKNENKQTPLKICNLSESQSNAKEKVETNETIDVDISHHKKETQHSLQNLDKELYTSNIQQRPSTCEDNQKPAINLTTISEVLSTPNISNNEENPLETSQNNIKVLQELPKEVFQFQTPKKLQTAQSNINLKSKIVPEQNNIQKITSTLTETFNSTHVVLPSISTNSPTPSNFSGIFSKQSSFLIVEEDNKKSHKKSPQFKPREYVLPAASVLCNMDNLENATKATKKLHWELLEGKNEQTEIEDDADIDSSDEEALTIKEEPPDNASTSPKQSSYNKSQKSSPSDTDTQTEDESLLNELRRQRGTSKQSSVVIPLKVHKLKQRKHKLPKKVKVKLKTLNRDTIDSFKDTSLITQMPFSIVFPKRPVGRPRKLPDINKKHKVEIIKQHKKRGRKPKNKPQEVNKCIILESKLDKSKELSKEPLEDVCEIQSNLLEYLKVRSNVIVNKQKQEETISDNNERIAEDLVVNNIENSVKILSTSVERLEICDESCTSKEFVKQLKTFDKQIEDFKYDDDHNTSMIYHKLDYSTDNTNISQQENSSQEFNSNLQTEQTKTAEKDEDISCKISSPDNQQESIKETANNRYSDTPSGKSNILNKKIKSIDDSTKLDAVEKDQELPSCSREIQENIFSSRESTLRSDTDTDKVSSEDPSRDSRKEKFHKSKKIKKSLMKKKLKTKIKNKVTTFISLEDIGIKVKPLKAHLTTFRIPKIKKDQEESIINSWKLESYIDNMNHKQEDNEIIEVENYKESAKDKNEKQQEKQKSPMENLAKEIENVEISTASNSVEKATKDLNKINSQNDNQTETPSNFIINFDNKPKTGKRKLFSPDIYEEQVNENKVEISPDTKETEIINEECLYLSKTHEPNPVKLRRKSLHFPIKETTSSKNYSESIETSSSSNSIKPPKKSLNIHRRILDDSTDEEGDEKSKETNNDKLISNETKTQTKPLSLIVNEENNPVVEIKESSSEISNEKDNISVKSSTPEMDLIVVSVNNHSNKKTLGNRRKSMHIERILPELKETSEIEKVKSSIPKRRKSMYVERPPSICSELKENEEKNPSKDRIERISPELKEKCALENIKQRRKSMNDEKRSSSAANKIEETEKSKSTKVTIDRTSPALKEKTEIEPIKDNIPKRRKSMYIEKSQSLSNEMGEIPKSSTIVVKTISPEPKDTDELAKVKRRKSPSSASSEVEEITTSKLRKCNVEKVLPELKERSNNDKVVNNICKRRKSMHVERPPSTSSEMEEIELLKSKKDVDEKITPESIKTDDRISKKQNLPKRRKSMFVERSQLASHDIENTETSKTKKDIVGAISTKLGSTKQNVPKRRKSMYVERPPSASSEMEETEAKILEKVLIEREPPDLKETKESQNIKQNIAKRRKSMYVEKSSSERTQTQNSDTIKDIKECTEPTSTANSKIDKNINENEEVPKTIKSLKMRRKSLYIEKASTSKVLPSITNENPNEPPNLSSHTQIETIQDANQIAENPMLLGKPQQEADEKIRKLPKPIVSLKMRRKSMYIERQEKEKIDEINKTKNNLDKQKQSFISKATEINEKKKDFIVLNKTSQKSINKEEIENTVPKEENIKDLNKAKPELTKNLDDSKVDKQMDLSIKIRRKSTYQEHIEDNRNSSINHEIVNKSDQNFEDKSTVSKSNTEESKLDLESSTKITQDFTFKLHRKSTNQRSLVKDETNKSKDSIGHNRQDHINPQQKPAVAGDQLEKAKSHAEVPTTKFTQKLKNDIETTNSKHVDVIPTEKSIKLRRKSTNPTVISGAGTNDELGKNTEVLQQSSKLNSKPDIFDTSSTKVPQTASQDLSQQTNAPDSDSSVVMSQENSIKLRRKSTNQRRIFDSSSDDDNEPLIKKPTVISNELKTPLTTINKTKSRRKRVVKVLSTSMDSPTNLSHTSHQSSCSASPLTSPTLNHPIFNREVSSSEFAASMPMTPNQQDDNKFKEIDSKLHAIFQSPQYTVDYKISPAVDAANLSILPPPSYETQPNVSLNETQDINQENDQSSINLTQINESAICLNASSHNNSEVKHLCLGSSEYRIEKVNDNVINLFISRKRKRKRNN
ncbi:FLICE-associated huge protein [Cochliomyia hominivorax]